MILARQVVQLEEEVGLARMGLNEFTKFSHHLVVQQIGRQRDGDAINGTLLDSLQELHTCNSQVFRTIRIIREAWSDFTRNIYGGTNGEEARLVAPRLAKQRQLARTYEVFEGDNTEGFAVLGETGTYRCDDTANGYIFATSQFADICQFVTTRIAQIVKDYLKFIQRVGRQIDTYQFAFLIQTFYVAPAIFTLRQGGCLYLQISKTAKQRVLCLLLLRLIELAVAHHDLYGTLAFCIMGKEVLTAQTKTVKATTQRQCFKGFAVDLTEVDALYEVEEVLIGSVLLALFDDSQCDAIAQPLDSSQTKAYLSFLVDTKLLIRLIDIRTQRSNTHRLTLVHQLRDFRYLVTAA